MRTNVLIDDELMSSALESVLNYRLLRRKGVTVRKTIDLIIGTFCIHNRFFLLHNDRDFAPLEKYRPSNYKYYVILPCPRIQYGAGYSLVWPSQINRNIKKFIISV